MLRVLVASARAIKLCLIERTSITLEGYGDDKKSMPLIRVLIIDKDSPALAQRIHAWGYEQNMHIVVEAAESAADALYTLTTNRYDIIICSAPIAHIDAVRWLHHITTLAPVADILLMWTKPHPAFKTTTPPLSRLRLVGKSVASIQLLGTLYQLVQQRLQALSCTPMRQREGVIRKVISA